MDIVARASRLRLEVASLTYRVRLCLEKEDSTGWILLWNCKLNPPAVPHTTTPWKAEKTCSDLFAFPPSFFHSSPSCLFSLHQVQVQFLNMGYQWVNPAAPVFLWTFPIPTDTLGISQRCVTDQCQGQCSDSPGCVPEQCECSYLCGTWCLHILMALLSSHMLCTKNIR